MLFEDTGEILGGLETAGKADFLDGHLRVPQQLDRFVDPDLVQVVQRGEVQVLGEQFAQVPFSDSGLRRDIADRDIGLVVQTDIGDRQPGGTFRLRDALRYQQPCNKGL